MRALVTTVLACVAFTASVAQSQEEADFGSYLRAMPGRWAGTLTNVGKPNQYTEPTQGLFVRSGCPAKGLEGKPNLAATLAVGKPDPNGVRDEGSHFLAPSLNGISASAWVLRETVSVEKRDGKVSLKFEMKPEFQAHDFARQEQYFRSTPDVVGVCDVSTALKGKLDTLGRLNVAVTEALYCKSTIRAGSNFYRENGEKIPEGTEVVTVEACGDQTYSGALARADGVSIKRKIRKLRIGRRQSTPRVMDRM